jgi:hypothetical protein
MLDAYNKFQISKCIFKKNKKTRDAILMSGCYTKQMK